MRLSVSDHDRDSAGLTYVYPVVSRRAGGVSVGINLNPNNACNWRCVYCQVPGLVFGSAPPIDLAELERELRGFLGGIVHGDWLARHVPEGARVFKDVAFSGNGEPTSAREFDRCVELVGRVLTDLELAGKVELVLITNGSLIAEPRVLRGLRAMRPLNGHVWFKVDSATNEGLARINTNRAGIERTRKNLALAAEACPTSIQTMMLARDGHPPSDAERSAYLAFLRDVVADRVPIRGVLLYGLARPSYQPEAPELSPLPDEWLHALARDIEALGLAVRVDP